MNLKQKATYLKGLAEGLGIDDKTKEGKLLLALVDAFDELAAETTVIGEDLDDLSEYVDELDSDLSEVEKELYDEDYDDEDDGEYSVICPSCNESVFLDDEDMAAEEIECPYCGEKIELEFDECECGSDCDCDDEECDCDDEECDCCK